jgi:multifunctional methyltransferase subunit TRM112
MVRLITHNLLCCHAASCEAPNNFPLAFRDAQISVKEAEFNPDFLRGFLPKIDWKALVQAAKSLGEDVLPEMEPDASHWDDEKLKDLHHVLLEVRGLIHPRYRAHHNLQIHVDEGAMVCPNSKCGHVYPISSGIPNMVRLCSCWVTPALVADANLHSCSLSTS